MKPNTTLDGLSPGAWVAADRNDAKLSDAYAESTGLDFPVLAKVFPSLRVIATDLQLARAMGLDAMHNLARSLNIERNLVEPPAITSFLKSYENLQKIYSTSLFSAMEASALRKSTLALAVSPPLLDAVSSIQKSIAIYGQIGAFDKNLTSSAFAGIDWAAVRLKAVEGVLALRPLIADVPFRDLGLISASLWSDTVLAPPITRALEHEPALAGALSTESAAYGEWLQHVDAQAVRELQADTASLGIEAHIHARGAVSTLAPDWREAEEAASIEAVIEASVEFSLPLRLEVPGHEASLEEVMAAKLPETLRWLRTFAAAREMPASTNRHEQAAFALRSALRAFYNEVTGQELKDKAEGLRQLLAPQIAERDSGPYLAASIGLLEGVYKPIGAAVYGRGATDASFNLWHVSALAAMAAIVTSWLEALASRREPQ